MNMTPQVAFAAAATVISLAFALATLDRWLMARRNHEAAWTVALFLFSGAAAALMVGAGMGWSAWSFRAFYYLGAIANVPVLALGTVWLLRPQWGRTVSYGVATFCLVGLGVMLVAPTTGTIPSAVLPQGSDIFGPFPRILAAVGSSLGALVILSGALWSLGSLVRHQGPRQLAAANGAIGLGTVVLSLGGLLNSTLNEMTAFAITLVVGIALIFIGFLVATLMPATAKLQMVSQENAA